MIIGGICTCVPSFAFNHPGALISMEEITTIKAHVEAKDQPFYQEWTSLLADSRLSSNWSSHHPATDIGGSEGTRQRASGDAMAAMYNALVWHVTGQTAYADHAVRLLMGWANVVTSANNQLFQYPCRDFAQAAELLRNADGSFYQGWEKADLKKFLSMVRNIFVPALRTQKTNGMSSWSAGAINGLLACGVLLDDQDIYDEALGYFYSKDIPGSITSCSLESGQSKEMGRDNVHAMLALYDLGNMAQTAWHQGDDLYGAMDNRLMKVFDYWCRYNSGHEDTAYEPWGLWSYISTHNNGFRLRPDGTFFECVYHHYREVKKMDESLFPYLSLYTKLARPEQNFGTLLYASSVETSPLWTVKPQQAKGVKAEAGLNCIYLSWNHPAKEDARGFKIYRSTDGKNFSAIKTWDFYTNNKYKDESVEAGVTYYYKVVLNNLAGNSHYSEVASATPQAGAALPDGWGVANIGTANGSALYTPNMAGSFAVNGTGKDVAGNSDSFSFLHTLMSGDGSIIVRLTSTKEAFSRVGIMFRSSLSANARTVALTLGGPGHRYCHLVARTTDGGETSRNKGNDFTYAPCWFKISREGNTFSGYQSRDGVNWFLVKSVTCNMSTSAHVGMFCCSGATTGGTYQAVFDHVAVSSSMP